MWNDRSATNIVSKLNDTDKELKRLLWAVGNISPIKRNVKLPNPIEYPTMKSKRLTSGRKLK